MFDTNGESTSFVNTLHSPVLIGILFSSIVRETLLPAGTQTQIFQNMPHKSLSLIITANPPLFITPPAAMVSFLLSLPVVVVFLEPQLQCPVSMFTPLTVDVRLVVIIALQGLQQWGL